MFRLQFASALTAVFTAIVGFYVTTVVEEIRSGVALVYDVERTDETSRLSIYNASRSASVTELPIGMSCVNDVENADCFRPDAPRLPEYHVPIKGEILRPLVDASTVDFEVSLLPGARVSYSVGSDPGNKTGLLFKTFPQRPADPPAPPPKTGLYAIADALADPSEAPPTPVFLDARTITGFLVQHYFSVIAWAMVVSCLLLAIFALIVAGRATLSLIWSKEPDNERQLVCLDLVYRAAPAEPRAGGGEGLGGPGRQTGDGGGLPD
ncbi:hypothetical protein [Paracoccus sp. pheM1]|uniref:hypothetical protein n=1 Tax=Paracoccus sp. pheM1 TaxID=2831675 RepID=UPI001BDB731E|nr:hypothetical protein [Paracoccus sp. pheM1]MBT0779256.1 hypothetical protein [Paracoccus sp. pheM1]